jgi:signal transduction histidine kinase
VALATLASAVGHEINNPLTAVVANLQLALEGLEGLEGLSKDASKSLLAEVAAGAKRVREIVQSMRSLAQGDSGNPECVHVVSPVRGA